MRTDIFTLAQGAVVLDGQLNVIGACDCFLAEKFPFSVSGLKLAIRLRHNATDSGNHKIEFRLIDEDGNVKTRIATTATLTVSTHKDAEEMATPIALPMAIGFDSPGNYRMEFYVDDELIGYTSITVRQK